MAVTMKLEDVRNALMNSDGKIFRVEFIKRTTGEVRVMVARLGVSKGVTGVGLKFDPLAKGLLTCFDMQKGQFRTINLDSVTSLRLAGKEMVVKQMQEVVNG
jgi:hypothetical protein